MNFATNLLHPTSSIQTKVVKLRIEVNNPNWTHTRLIYYYVPADQGLVFFKVV